ncbi:23S rRNA (pseudouridine(1915)-N(3))-methyltransferase RlmH [Chrysiogenes arsenatis]|uniref:23S rRNA (pseudouridine(1915)-N(3))-methyltransferase RlmH n=1 Tax=Chrysiogenes arsenatis TaxID=309797 RepID=UPI00048899D9|nr:23S rRNA (pseudouridine(1915)-N(3))-methyltransferase RlmH [Chrysiogenes arsenatis]
MKYRLLSFGKVRDRHFQALIEDFEKRIGRFVPFEATVLKDAKIASHVPVAQVQEEEGERLLKAVSSDTSLILFDEQGDQLTSRQFAEWIGSMESWNREIAFAIGGALGHGTLVRTRAERRVSLSPLTFNHYLARLVALEQLYRALTLLRGMPYHND